MRACNIYRIQMLIRCNVCYVLRTAQYNNPVEANKIIEVSRGVINQTCGFHRLIKKTTMRPGITFLCGRICHFRSLACGNRFWRMWLLAAVPGTARMSTTRACFQ